LRAVGAEGEKPSATRLAILLICHRVFFGFTIVNGL